MVPCTRSVKALFTLLQKSETVIENGETTRRCGQALTLTLVTVVAYLKKKLKLHCLYLEIKKNN